MAKVDLHLHTTCSDGRLSPAQLVRLCARRGLRTIAITDHDSTEGVGEALDTAEDFPELTVIPGIELSTDVPGGEIHLLGYFVDYRHPELQEQKPQDRPSNPPADDLVRGIAPNGRRTPTPKPQGSTRPGESASGSPTNASRPSQ